MKHSVLSSISNRVARMGVLKVVVIVAIAMVSIFALGSIGLIVLFFTIVIPLLQNSAGELPALVNQFAIPDLLAMFGIQMNPALIETPTDINAVIDGVQEQYLQSEQGEVAGEATENSVVESEEL
jgi:predicted PurR-regulated permease PerM